MRIHYYIYTAALSLLPLLGAGAQAADDPTVMTVAGRKVSRAEFEYSYRKNNGPEVIDRKTVGEYARLYADYRLKVQAALDARLDTLRSFQDEFAQYRDQQIRPAIYTDADMERQARRIYADYRQRVDSTGGLVRARHILVRLRQKATEPERQRARQRIDSLYRLLRGGADFEALARQCSDDKASARNGGLLPWMEHGQTLPEFEREVYALQKGETSHPFLSPAGWHIARVEEKGPCFAYDSLRTSIMQFMERRGIREALANERLDSLAREGEGGKTRDEVLATVRERMMAADPQLRYLIGEYHDGLLLYEISNRTVWEKAAQDKEGQQRYFDAHRKRYKYDKPRYKGMAYHVKVQEDVAAVKAAVRSLPFDKWAEKLRLTFNNDTTLRIRVEKGIFRQGDNAVVDRMVFGQKDVKTVPVAGFPIDAVYGRKVKRAETAADVADRVLTDYQGELEREWVAALRAKYEVTIDETVLRSIKNE